MTEIGYWAIDNNNDDNFKCIWDRSLEVIEDWSVPAQSWRVVYPFKDTLLGKYGTNLHPSKMQFPKHSNKLYEGQFLN